MEQSTVEWDIIDTAIANNETLDPAHFFDKGNPDGTLFNIHTIATVTSNQGSENPTVSTAVVNDILCVAINSTALTFGESFQHCQRINKFDSDVNCLALSQDADFLVCALQDGSIVLTYLPLNKCILKKTLLDFRTIDGGSSFNKIIFISAEDNGLSEILVFTTTGNVYQFTNINLMQLKMALEDNSMDIQQVLASVVTKEINIECIDSCLFTNFECNRFVFTLNHGAKLLSLENFKILHSVCAEAFEGTKLLKGRICSNGRYAIVLDNANTLSVICMRTFIIVETWSSLQIDDFSLVETAQHSSFVCLDIKVVILARFNGERYLKLCKFPSAEVTYSVKVASFTILVEMPLNQDNILFLEGVKNDGSVVFSHIKLNEVVESSKEARLSHFLNKRQFETALEFATTFGMPKEIIYKAKANYLMEQLQPWKSRCLSKDIITNLKFELFTSLNSISDIRYVITCCITATLPSSKDTSEILKYAKSKLHSENCVDNDLSIKVLQTMKKLETFNLVFGECQFCSKWDDFMKADLWEELLLYLSQHKFGVVSLIWEHYAVDFVQWMTKHDVTKLLEKLPETVMCSSIFNWLKFSVFPLVLMCVPDSLECMAEYVVNASSVMELSDKIGWPDNAITLLQMFLDTCEQLSQDAVNSVNFDTEFALLISKKVQDHGDSILHRIQKLLDHFHDLKTLRLKYNCKISLADYSQENKDAVIFILLEWINSPEDIPGFINDFLKSFCKRHGIFMDEVLYCYIKDLMDHTEYDWWHWEEPSWEKQILAIISCLEEEEFYLKAFCQVLKVMPVPWSSAVQNVVNDCLLSTHPLVQSIKSEISRVGQKVVQIKYGLQKFNISCKPVAKMLVNYIIRQDSPTVMDDALIVVGAADLSAVDAYMCRIRYLIESENLAGFVSLLENLPSAVIAPCCKRLALFVSDIYDTVCNKDILLTAAIHSLHCLKEYCSVFEYEEYDELLQTYISCQKAEVHFQNTFDMLDVTSSLTSEDIFECNVKRFLTSGEFYNTPIKPSPITITGRKQPKNKPTLHHLLYMGQLLRLAPHEIWKVIAKTAYDFDKFEVVQTACVELSSTGKTADFAAANLSVFIYFIEKLESKLLSRNSLPLIIDLMKKLQSFAAVYCEEFVLEQCAAISHWINVLKNLQDVRYKANVDFTRSFVMSEIDPYLDWIFTPIFKDTAIQVDWSKVIVYTQSCVQNSRKGDQPVENVLNNLKSSVAVVGDFIQHLRSKGHLLLAYYVYMESVSRFLINETFKTEHEEVYHKVSKGRHALTMVIMNSVINQRHLDFSLLLGYLLSLPVELSCFVMRDLEKRCSYDYRKLFHISLIGKAFAQKWCLLDHIVYYTTLQKESEWGRRLTHLRINFADAFKKPSVEKMKLIPLMASHAQINVGFLKRYCNAFNLDVEEALLSVLNILLTNSSEQMTKLSQTLVTNRSQSQILQVCSHIIKKIGNTGLLLKHLENIYSKVNSYDYEVLEFILENTRMLANGDVLMEESVKNGLVLLTFLKDYKRVGEPTDLEIDLWLEKSSEVSSHNDQIKDRLPYHSLLTPSIAIQILAPELTAATIDIWLEMSSLLKLSRNELIMISVENIVRQAISRSATPLTIHESRSSRSPNKNLVIMIHKLVSSIDDLEKATACATSVVKRLPPSASKIFAVKAAIPLAKKWWEVSKKKKAEQALQVLQKFYVTLASSQVLHTYGLQEPHLLLLIEHPEKLISELLEHPSIEKQYWFNSGRFPDVHSACELIGANSNISINNLYTSLLHKWLLPVDYTDGGFDETMAEELNIPKFTSVIWEENVANDAPNLKRAIYLLQRGSVDDNADYLANVLCSDLPTVTYRHKWRALKCLLYVLDSGAIEDLIKRNINEVRSMMKLFYFGSQLEELHLPFGLPPMNDFVMTRDLVLQLLQSYSHTPTALVLASSICIQSKVFILQIWNTILRGMIDCKLLGPLRESVFLLSAHSQLMQSSEFFKAWNTVLKDESSDTKESVRGLSKLILLHRCPIIMELDLLSLAEYFNHASLPVLAVDCFLHLPDPPTRMQHIEKFITLSTVHSTLQHLKELKHVIVDLYHLDELSKVIFLAVLNNRLVLEVKNSSQSQWFLKSSLQKVELNSLLEYAAQNRMLKECFAIMRTHKQFIVHFKTEKIEEAIHDDHVTELKVYAETNKLQNVLALLNLTTR